MVTLSEVTVRTAMEGIVPGKRGRGRPRWRWRDDIYEWTEKTLLELISLSMTANVGET